MTETRDDLLQGIRAMDDSIQTLKDEMNKLMSVYEHVKLKPDGSGESVEVNLKIRPPEKSVTPLITEKSVTPLITEMGKSVLEVVGDEAVIRFKDFSGKSVEEATASANVTISAANKHQDTMNNDVSESEYNSELGVYHENEISGKEISVINCNLYSFLNYKKSLSIGTRIKNEFLCF